jgi:hypothetical protein
MASLFAVSVFAADMPAAAGAGTETAMEAKAQTPHATKHVVAKKKVTKKARKVKPTA